MEDLRTKFMSAADFLPSLVPSLKPEVLLKFYGLYKQSTVGKCNTSRPNWYAMEAKRKWDAWNDLGDMSQEEAMTSYISLMTDIAPDWEAPKQGWVSVSRMCDSDSEIEEFDKDVWDYTKEGDVEKVKLFLDSSDLSGFDENGIGLIHWAADRGHKDVVEYLLDAGVDINLKDSTGQTPLHYACACGHKEVVELLLERKADSKISCEDGIMPIDLTDDDFIKSLIVDCSSK